MRVLHERHDPGLAGGEGNVDAAPIEVRDGVVTGAHRFPSDVVRPGMLYGRVLRGPAYGATLESLDLSAVMAMKDVAAQY